MHVVSLTCSCQGSFCSACNELSVDKVFKYSQSPHISAASRRSAQHKLWLHKISPPSLPDQLPAGGWGEEGAKWFSPSSLCTCTWKLPPFCFVPCVRENSKNEHIYARKVCHVYLICSKPGCLYECKRFTSIVRKAGEGTGSYHLHCTGFHQLPYTLPAASTTRVWGKLKLDLAVQALLELNASMNLISFVWSGVSRPVTLEVLLYKVMLNSRDDVLLTPGVAKLIERNRTKNLSNSIEPNRFVHIVYSSPELLICSYCK